MPTGGSLMNEQIRASAVWREALAIVLRHPVATVVPALFLGALTETPLPAPRSPIPPRSALGVPDRVARFLPLRSLRGATDFGGPPQRGVYPPAQGAEKPGPRGARRTGRRCSLFRRHRAADSGGEPAGDTRPLANDALVFRHERFESYNDSSTISG